MSSLSPICPSNSKENWKIELQKAFNLLFLAIARSGAHPLKRILFVCTGNSFRSAVAEALLKKVRGDVRVESAGIQPASKIASNAKRLLEEKGALKNLKQKPEGIRQKNLKEYELIVVMKEHHKNEILQRHPQVKDKILVWDIDDPIYLPAGSEREVVQEIKKKVEELAESI
jgi:protein-tyrosine-phosphatase